MPESIDSVKYLIPVTIITSIPVVAISVVLNGFETVMMLEGGSARLDSSIHQASGYPLERIYKKAARRQGSGTGSLRVNKNIEKATELG